MTVKGAKGNSFEVKITSAKVLGKIKVGDGAVIGGNIWVDTDVPAGAKLVQKK